MSKSQSDTNENLGNLITVNDSFLYDQVRILDLNILNSKGKSSLTKELEQSKVIYIPYTDRVGLGLEIISKEMKRELDQVVTKELNKALPTITSKRFNKVYCDVKIYPKSKLNSKKKRVITDDLHMIVTFIVACPADDRLDTLTQMNILGLFSDEAYDPKIKKLSAKLNFSEKAGISTAIEVINRTKVDGANDISGSLELEYFVETCDEKDFEKYETQAKGTNIQKIRTAKNKIKLDLEKITLDNVDQQIRILIAKIADALDIKNIDPSALERNDTLYSLAGFDHSKSLSIEKSIMVHFNVLGSVGGPFDRIVTIGNAIDFAKEMIELRSDDEEDWNNSTEDSNSHEEVENQPIYEGDLKDGLYTKSGTLTWPDGSKYKGNFKEGLFNGKGTFTWPDGSSHVGQWKDGKQSGKGIFLDAAGNKYEGNFEDGLYHGYGVMIWANNALIYKGNWENGNRTGYGEMIWPNGGHYEGMFENNQIDGQGRHTSSTGMISNGIFKDGKLFEKNEITLTPPKIK